MFFLALRRLIVYEARNDQRFERALLKVVSSAV